MKFLAIILLLMSTSAHARIYNPSEATFATYFKGTFGTSYVGKDGYEKSSGASTLFSDDDEAKYNYSGEVGFIFPSKFLNFKIGLNVVHPATSSGIPGKNSSGAQLLSVDSSVYGIFPMGHIEYYVASNSLGRVYVSVGGGYGKVSLTNKYHLYADGDAAYTTPNDFKIHASATTFILETAVGYEMSFVQNTTLSFDFGYRYAEVDELKYDGAGEDFIGGTHNDGDPVIESNGKKKSLDLGGVFTGLSFRFFFK